MALTFLDITNETLRRLNEVPLTAGSFASATGYHAQVKDAVNTAIRAILQSETEWPFCHVTGTQVLTVGTAEYTLPADCRSVDWNTFYQRRDDALNADAHPLAYLDFDVYHATVRAADDNTDQGAAPAYVVRTQQSSFLVSPKPDQPYTLEYQYWSDPLPLDAATDTTIIPAQYRHVVVDGAMIDSYLFRGNKDAADVAQARFTAGLKKLRTLLINRPTAVTDTRTSGSLGVWDSF